MRARPLGRWLAGAGGGCRGASAASGWVAQRRLGPDCSGIQPTSPATSNRPTTTSTTINQMTTLQGSRGRGPWAWRVNVACWAAPGMGALLKGTYTLLEDPN